MHSPVRLQVRLDGDTCAVCWCSNACSNRLGRGWPGYSDVSVVVDLSVAGKGRRHQVGVRGGGLLIWLVEGAAGRALATLIISPANVMYARRF